MKARSLVAYLLALAAVFYLQWQSLPPLPAAAPAVAPVDSWQLPELHRADLAAAYKTFMARAPWGSIQAGTAGGPGPEPRWSLAGTMHRGGERYLLLRLEGQPVRYLSVGDSLPGDHEILAIHEDTVCVRVNKKRRLLRVFER